MLSLYKKHINWTLPFAPKPSKNNHIHQDQLPRNACAQPLQHQIRSLLELSARDPLGNALCRPTQPSVRLESVPSQQSDDPAAAHLVMGGRFVPLRWTLLHLNKLAALPLSEALCLCPPVSPRPG